MSKKPRFLMRKPGRITRAQSIANEAEAKATLSMANISGEKGQPKKVTSAGDGAASFPGLVMTDAALEAMIQHAVESATQNVTQNALTALLSGATSLQEVFKQEFKNA